MILALIGFYPIAALVSIVYGIIRLSSPGISKESRKFVLVRHVLTIIGFIFAEFYPAWYLVSLLLDLP
jgi:hypothetical protein